ncbi:MAG: DUF6390 family protein [Patescibacteria group bacterium]|nr:DUF6390 family protein [Patescibacteria group bacterium]MDD5164792.1 DUF6390 family protein [Patescibacteria group bacterium]MDD5534786.1 DUF6390 family protein [Patescibacteria group bacterium]
MLKGEILAAIYSWGCQRDKELKTSEIFKKFIASNGKKFRYEAREALPKLKPTCYYGTIAKLLKISNPYTTKVIEAYWLGYKWTSQKNSALNHNFTVLNNMPKIKPSEIPTLIKYGIEDCMISFGEVKEIKKEGSLVKKIVVEVQPLEFKDKISFGEKVRIEINWYPKLLPNLKINDWISIHWRTARQILDSSKKKSLLESTLRALEFINTQTN